MLWIERLGFLLLVGLLVAFGVDAEAQTTAADFATSWLSGAAFVRSVSTSTSSIRLSNGLIRVYQNPRSGVVGNFTYSDSADGSDLSTAGGVTFSGGSVPGNNPSVVRLANGTYLLVFGRQLSSTAFHRALYSATSTDGVSFGALTALPVTSIDLNANGNGLPFQDVPNLVLEPDGAVRVYYVASGASIGSMRSTDNGVTWVQDSGYRLTGGSGRLVVDPAVILMPDNTRAMFFSYQVAGDVGTVRLATSNDGVNFTVSDTEVGRAGSRSIYDPDIYQTSDGRWRMLAGVGSTQTTIDLYATSFPATAASPVIPQSGWWWNPSEGGRGFSLEVRGNNLFFAGFLYYDDGTPIWFVQSGVMAYSHLSLGTLQLYGGGQTLSGAYQVPTVVGSVGTIGLRFDSPTTAVMTWPGGTVNLQRFDFVANGVATGPAAGMPETGWWWNAGEGGRGYFLEIQGTTLFLAAYMYDARGQATWYISQGAMTSTSAYSGTLSACSGGQTLTSAFRTATCTANQGAVALQFDSTTTATLTLPNGNQVRLSRFIF